MWATAFKAVVYVGSLLVGVGSAFFTSEPEAREDGEAIEAAYCAARPQDCHDAGGGQIHIYRQPCFIDPETNQMYC